MPTLLEDIAPQAGVDIFGDAINLESHMALAGRVAYLPVCTYQDLEKTIRYSHNPYYYEQEDQALYAERGDAYAWRRLPRFLDRYKEIRERMRDLHPNELVLSLDVGSSIPIYSEMMRAHWLRKCGDHAQQALRYAVEIFEDNSRLGNAVLSRHMRKDSDFKHNFISCLQVALYCIPYELSGDRSGIKDYLETTMRMLLANCTSFIDRKERKNEANLMLMYEHLGIEYDPAIIQRVPMERAWRIDMVLGSNEGQTPHQSIQSTNYSAETRDIEVTEQAQRLYRQAGKAHAAGRVEEAKLLRDQASELLGNRESRSVSAEESAYFLDDLILGATEYLIKEGYAPPVRFVSMDMRDPIELLEGANSSLDAETKLSAFCRRTFERTMYGDPDHIHDQIKNVRDHLAPETVASITSTDAFPVHASPPRRIRDMGRFADQVASDMFCLAETLMKRGEYMTFAWGRIGQPGSESRFRPVSRARAKAIKNLPAEVEKKLTARNTDGQYLISLDLHTQREVLTWMSQGEFDNLLGISPTLGLDKDEQPKVMRIRRHKSPAPSGRLLGAKQLR